MQKKIIALAVAGLASSAVFAQSNVTIYGVADVFYGNLSADQGPGVKDTKFSGLGDGGLSGSRLGFRVEEDLGNGWKAHGLMELGTLAFNGGGVAGGAGASGAGAHRQSHVGLSNNTYGTFLAGRIYNSGTNLAGKYDAEAGSGFGAGSRITTTTGLNLSIDAAGDNNARVNNSLAWLSPNWSGFTVQLQYAFGENGEQTLATTGSDDARMWGLGLDYSNGPFGIGFVYNDWSDYGGTSAAAGSKEIELKEWFVGGSYDFGMAKLFASYQDFDLDNAAAAAAQGATVAGVTGVNGAKSEGDIWTVGVTIPVFKVGTLTLNYASLDRDTRAGTGLAKVNRDADGWGISYRHALSKRTTAYVGYVDMSNDKGSAIAIGAAVAAPAAGKDTDGFAMGVRHTF